MGTAPQPAPTSAASVSLGWANPTNGDLVRTASPLAPAGRLLVLVALLAGCSGPAATTPVAEAPAHYEPVLAEVRDAVDGALGVAVGWSADDDARAATDAEGRCTFTSADYRADDVDAHGADWDAVVEAVTPVLEEHGFEPGTTGPDVGGWLVIEAEDDAGAFFRLAVKGRGELGIDGALVLADQDGACTLG